MGYTTFNQKQTDTLNQPAFLGEGLNVARFDQMKHRFIDRATIEQISQFWVPEEIDLSQDKIDFRTKLTEGQRYIFMANLRYQTLLDSIQERAPMLAFGPLVSIPELESFIDAWAFFELIHSRSYTHILRNLVPNPDEVFNNIVTDPAIISRAESLTSAYDDLIELGMIYSVYGYGFHMVPSKGEHMMITPTVMRRAIIRALATVNALEGVRFYVSFATSFAFAEKLDAMQGSVKILRFIARDEAIHRQTVGNILKAFASGKEGAEWKADFEAMIPEMTAIYRETFEQEIVWAEHLFSEGRTMPGLNTELLTGFMKLVTNQTMAGGGLTPAFEKLGAHTLPWVRKFLYSGNVQVAPQEAEISSYLVGRINTVIDLPALAAIKLLDAA